ncbi:MAG TPA: hypothetical protein VGG72_15740 [Bryobacteraceae bacterium]
MPFCSHCGSELQGRFCAKCGAPAPGVGPAPSTPPRPIATPLSLPGLDDNVAAALCYLALVLTGVLFLFLEPYNRNKNVRFHAFQSIFVWIGMILASFGVRIVFGSILDGPHTYWLMDLIWSAFGLSAIALWLTLMYRAYNGERWVTPVVGPMAERFA